MRIVFFGATELGYKCCSRIIENRLAEVVGIFTIPKEFNISYSDKPVTNVTFADFHKLGKEFNIPVVDVVDKMASYKNKVAEFKPDFLLVIGWYYMIPKNIRDLAKIGCAGFHSSLLPKYRGGAPLVWAMINGEKETGLSFFYLEDGVDEGDIIAQNKIYIEDADTIKTLIDKTTIEALNIVDEFIPKLSEGTAPRISQDHSKATTVPQRSPGDGDIDWNWDSKRIKNFIKAQTKPYPGAFTVINGKKITIWDADIIDE